MEISLLARLLGTARTVTPLAPVNAATLALTQLPLGHTVRAQVAARLADGSFRVVINDAPLKLALPANAKAGDVVTLRLVSREPQLEFDLDRPLAPSEPRLSGAARLIGQILSDPAPLRPQQLQPVAATPIVEAAKLREPLARAIQRSGLFYEAHQARWIDGDYPLAALQDEPQAAIARQMQIMGYDAFANRDRPTDAELSLIRTATRGQTEGDLADASEQADARNSHASGHADPAGESDVPGRDGTPPHASTTRGPLGTLFDEQPASPALTAARALSPSATAALGSDDPAQARIVHELAPIMRQQLEAIETRQIVWQGELWPGQSMHWQIADREADPQHPESGREWLTRFALQLPALGEINADLAIGAHGVRIVVTARDSATAEALRGAAPELQQALAAAGLRVARLEMRLHER